MNLIEASPCPLFEPHRRSSYSQSPCTATEDATHHAYCAAGITTQWNTYPGDHILTDTEAIGDVMSWFAGRFAGLPAAGNC